jgi:transcription elongation factor Elf1
MSEVKPCNVCTSGTWEPFGRYCEKHDVCVDCGIKRKDLTETPWGVRIGAFQCKSCEERRRKRDVTARQAAGFDHDWEDEITCPHCGYKFGNSFEYGQGGQEDCPECEEEFEFEAHYIVHYSTTKIAHPELNPPKSESNHE